MIAAKIQKPTVGRILHFVDLKERHCAAMVCHVWNERCVNLSVCDPNGNSYPQTYANYSADAAPGTWHWPEAKP